MITIISDDKEQKVGQRIREVLQRKGIETEYVSVSNADIKPCYGCGGCTYKTYGKCVIRDDTDEIFAKLIRSEVMLLVTPVTWGSYSYQIKKFMDKCAVIGDRHYYIVKGEIVKGIQGDIKRLYAVGVKEECSKEEKDTFRGLVAENINIMNINGNSCVIGNYPSDQDISDIIEGMAG